MVKDLSGLGRDLNRVVIIDDDPSFTRLQRQNAIHIKPFIGDLQDRELVVLGSNFFPYM